MNGYIGVTNNSVLTAGTRLSAVRQPSKLAMVMDFDSHYVVSTSTANTNRADSIRARYGGQMAVVFADGHTEVLPVDSVFPVNVSVANSTTNSFWLGN
jgi:prepilin-type processing-associated H-X9-DG protein